MEELQIVLSRLNKWKTETLKIPNIASRVKHLCCLTLLPARKQTCDF
ncbi:hypothetical protein T03_14512 [Trichinella britovi]|uniref:Uncharacterized protein n=1 Tax=Trichinella britovi TaxID=45882 RepID=A0A0V1B9D2_TRIBR|nr:hypothetical protein T03_14512 [Trichinella britovi]